MLHALSCFRPDPMELDNLLSEMALSNAHTELYFKFLRKKFIVSIYIATVHMLEGFQ